MAETWYARTGTGAACGPGTRRPLNQTPGTTPATQDITSEHTWNRVESARTVAAGDWSVMADLTTGSGGGAPNRVTCVVERRNSSCVVQETLLNVQSGNLPAGATQEITFGPVANAAVTFQSGDILTVRLVRSNGGRTQVLRFDSAALSDADTRLLHPDLAGTIHQLAGIASSVSSAVGAIVLLTALAGSAAGVSSGIGALKQTYQITGVAVSNSSGLGALGRVQPIAGITTGASSGVGDIYLQKALAGSTLGQSSGAGAVIKTSGMAGVAISTSSGVGQLRAQYALAGAAAGTSSAAGSLSRIHVVSGIGEGTSLGTANLALLRVLGGIATGISGGVGDLTIVSGDGTVHQLQGATLATSSGVGVLLKTSALAGVSVAFSSGMGNLAQTHTITGQTAGVSSGTAALARISPLAGSAEGSSSGTAALVVLWQLSGTTAGESSGIGNLSVVGPGEIVHDLMGTAVSVSLATGALSLNRPLDGAASGHSSLLLYWAGTPHSRSVGVQ